MQGFLHCVWSPRMPYLAVEGNRGEKKKKKLAMPYLAAEGNRGGEKKKKSRQAHRASRQRTKDPPRSTYAIWDSCEMAHITNCKFG